MRALILLISLLAMQALAQQRPAEIDPNTKIEGGADVRGSGRNAGQQPRTDPEAEARAPTRDPVDPYKLSPKEDRPISARKPQDVDREREEQAAKGETAGETAKPQ